jgi:hypothetical protein
MPFEANPTECRTITGTLGIYKNVDKRQVVKIAEEASGCIWSWRKTERGTSPARSTLEHTPAARKSETCLATEAAASRDVSRSVPRCTGRVNALRVDLELFCG